MKAGQGKEKTILVEKFLKDEMPHHCLTVGQVACWFGLGCLLSAGAAECPG